MSHLTRGLSHFLILNVQRIIGTFSFVFLMSKASPGASKQPVLLNDQAETGEFGVCALIVQQALGI
jgi:hypothetical protein